MENVHFVKTKKGMCLAAVLLVLASLMIWACYGSWHYQKDKFHDLTVELGTESISLRDFMTEYAKAGKVGFVSDVTQVDLSRVGEYTLVLRHGSQQETVCLTVRDTAAPSAEFLNVVTLPVTETLDAAALVGGIQDESQTRVYFLSEPNVPEDYSDVLATVVVEDRYGNSTQGECKVSWRWLEESYTLELGDKLTKKKLLLDAKKDETSIDQSVLDAINASGVGSYTVESIVGERTNICTVTVQDTTGPALKLKDVKRRLGVTVELKDFVESASDASGEVELRLLSPVDCSQKGIFPVTVEAKDIHGNVTTKEATLFVATDSVAPTIRGMKNMTVKKHSTPDFMEGVSAEDIQDGVCEVTCDTGKLDLTKSGTYYITYRAADKAGNVATARRRVTVQHDLEDTKAMVISLAKKLSNDPERIRNYVRSSIGYNHYWGGEDPVWHGFTNKTGNCYVHALCLKAVFDYKGIESRLIWVQNKTHYWLIVNIDGQWKHIDPTPGRLHSRFSLMNDAQRLKTLSGRTWDTTLWPECT